MIIDLRKLSISNSINIDEYINISDDYYKNIVKNIIDCHFTGSISYNENNNIMVVGECSGTMVLQDAITLEDDNLDFNIEINVEITKNDNFRLEIEPILWENIVLEVPISYKKKKNQRVSYSGDGWSLNKEE